MAATSAPAAMLRITASRAAAERWGVGAGASHLLAGHFAPHAALEAELATFVQPCADAAALTFSTGYLANLAILTALAGRDVNGRKSA